MPKAFSDNSNASASSEARAKSLAPASRGSSAEAAANAGVAGVGELQGIQQALQRIQSEPKRDEAMQRLLQEIAFQSQLLALNTAVQAQSRRGDGPEVPAAPYRQASSLARRSHRKALDLSRPPQ